MITENPMTALERRSVSTLAMLYSFRMLGLFMVLPLLAVYADDLPGATPALIGLALGIYGLSQALLQIPLGWLSDKVGRKPVILAGLVVFTLGSLLAANAETITGVVFGRLLQGAGAIAGTVMALLADLTREEQRTKAMAVVGISIGASFALALVLGPLVASWGGLAAVFYLTAGLAFLGVVLVLFRVPSPPVEQVAEEITGPALGLVRRSLYDAQLARLNLGVFSLHFILMACFLLVPRLLETSAGISPGQHWKVYLATLLVSLAGMLPMMKAAERRGLHDLMFLSGIALLLLSLLVFGFMPGAMPLYLGMLIFFTGFNYLEATLPSQVSKVVFTGGKGTALGMYSTCQFLGAFSGGALGGWILQVSSPQALFLLCATVTVIWLFAAYSGRGANHCEPGFSSSR